MELIEDLVALLIPIGICVVMPVLVIWLISRISINADNKRAEVLIEAIKSNGGIDAYKLAEAFSKPRKTALEVLNKRLLYGCIWTLLGIMSAICALIFANTMPWGDIQYPLMIISGLCLSLGIGFLIVYFATRKSVLDNPDKKS